MPASFGAWSLGFFWSLELGAWSFFTVMSAPLLQLENATIRFGGLTAVSELNLNIGEHELVGLIGPNGAGKTTAFNLITGVYRPTGGTIRFRGEPTTGLPAYSLVRLGIARTFQNIRLFPSMT